ncbi:MAG TPA: translation initiation factor IF-3 [Bacteroidales bacterium]|nr:translation initiation factor IF-3 [Bacteroidales bacterium]
MNNEIDVPQVRVVGDNIEKPGIYPIAIALKMAERMNLDLVEISAQTDPPVCKIIDYQKYLYQRRKKAKEMKANASKIVVKEIRFGPNTDEHDYQFKLKHAIEFLKDGAKVKSYVFFRGRSIVFSEQGEKLLLRFAVDLEDYGKAEQMPKLEGKRMIMMLAPLKTTKKK